jgi:hypothetical protein
VLAWKLEMEMYVSSNFVALLGIEIGPVQLMFK